MAITFELPDSVYEYLKYLADKYTDESMLSDDEYDDWYTSRVYGDNTPVSAYRNGTADGARHAAHWILNELREIS